MPPSPIPRLPEDDDFTVHAGGKIFGGWTEMSVARSVEGAASHFELISTDRVPDIDAALAAVMKPGVPVEVFLGADKILTGYLDWYLTNIDADTHQVSLAGRSRTADLVDCSADVRDTKWQFSAVRIGDLARIIARAYNIKVLTPDGDPELPIPVGVVRPGESAFDVIEEAARMVGMLVWDNADGDLVISKGGTSGRAANPIVMGFNIEAARARLRMDNRYSTYLVLGESRDEVAGSRISRGEASDPGVPRNRLKVIVEEVPAGLMNYSQRRAQWEMSRRLGQSRQVHVLVTGWRMADGQLWRPNSLVRVKIPEIGLDEDLAIVGATWRRNAGAGTITELKLIPQAGLEVQPVVRLPQIQGVGQPAPH